MLLPEVMPPGLLGSWCLSPGPTGMGRMLGWIGMVTLWHPGEQQLGSARLHTFSLIEALPLQFDRSFAIESMYVCWAQSHQRTWHSMRRLCKPLSLS